MFKQVLLQHVKIFSATVVVLSCSQNAAFAVLADPTTIAGQSSAVHSEFASDRILVKFKDTGNPRQRQALNKKLNARVVNESGAVSGLQVVRITSPATLGATLRAYQRDPNVVYAEPDYRLKFYETLPNDPKFSEQWALRNIGLNNALSGADINAARAWDITTGRPDVYIGIVDTGVDYTHPDLAANMWVNPGEIAGNGIDDDGNGYIDDVHGINTVTGSGDPMDAYGHGTHVSGTIAAQGNNNIGVTGINWSAKIVACSLFDADSLSAFVSGAVKCLDYLYDLKTKHGINIVATNNSWGWNGGPSQALQDAIARQKDAGILFVAAAGNEAFDNDKTLTYPANYALPNVIAVAAIDDTNHKAQFSNYGRTTVHISAPGVDILSTTPGNKYQVHSGTSMAAPHVVGVLGLLKAQNMSRDWIKLKNLLLAGGEVVDSMHFTISGRRLLAAGDGGRGALTCVGQNVVHRLSPHSDTVILNYGAAQTLDLSALSIVCDHAGTAPRVVVAETGQTLVLADDGANGDSVAGDGVFAGQLSIPQDQVDPITLEFPDGDHVNVTFARNYEPPTTTSGQWRDLSTGAHEVFLGEESMHVMPLPFPLRIGDREEPFQFLAISGNGYVIPTADEAAAYSVFSTWFNFPLPVRGFDAVIAPFWDDLSPGASGRVYWVVRGAAPQRELMIEWRNFEHYGLRPGSGTVTFQLVLFEGNTNALFNYADVMFGVPAFDHGASARIGIQSTAGIAREFYVNIDSLQLNNGMSIMWQMPAPTSEEKKSWFRRTFLGGLDLPWIVMFGFVALLTHGRRMFRRRQRILGRISAQT